MFTRSPVGEQIPLEPLKNANASPSKPAQPRSGSTEPGKSVISNDFKILGQDLKIISRGTLQVDAGAEIIIGEQGKVTGTVAAERVIVRGRTSDVALDLAGVTRATTVALQASARVEGDIHEGDIHHMSLAIEQGAQFDGRCRRLSSPGELQLDLEAHG